MYRPIFYERSDWLGYSGDLIGWGFQAIDLWRISPASDDAVPSVKCLWKITRSIICVTFWTTRFGESWRPKSAQILVSIMLLHDSYTLTETTIQNFSGNYGKKCVVQNVTQHLFLRHLQSLLCTIIQKRHVISHGHLTEGTRASEAGLVLQWSNTRDNRVFGQYFSLLASCTVIRID